MTEQTAMQELYSWFENTENWSRPDHKKEYEYQDILNKINNLIKKEKQQIMDAYKADTFPCSDSDSEQYYNETYKNQIK